MQNAKIQEEYREECVKLYKSVGEAGLFRKIVGKGIINSSISPNQDIKVLELSEQFFILSRVDIDNSEIYFAIGKALRRAAHKLYRALLSHDPEKQVNKEKFLNRVK